MHLLWRASTTSRVHSTLACSNRTRTLRPFWPACNAGVASHCISAVSTDVICSICGISRSECVCVCCSAMRRVVCSIVCWLPTSVCSSTTRRSSFNCIHGISVCRRWERGMAIVRLPTPCYYLLLLSQLFIVYSTVCARISGWAATSVWQIFKQSRWVDLPWSAPGNEDQVEWLLTTLRPPTLALLFPTHLIETRKIIAAHSTKCHDTQSTQASSQASKALGQRITHSTDDPYAFLLYSFSLSLSLPPLPVSSPRATKQVHYILARWQRLSCLIKTNQVNEHEFITHPQPQDRRTDTHTNTHRHTYTHTYT